MGELPEVRAVKEKPAIHLLVGPPASIKQSNPAGLDSVAPYQNCSRIIVCRMRGSRTPFTVPNPLMLFTVPSAFR